MWKNQKGLCPICGTIINKETGWNMHKNNTNKIIIHPECHKDIHSNVNNK